jgi:hypothetical protein
MPLHGRHSAPTVLRLARFWGHACVKMRLIQITNRIGAATARAVPLELYFLPN